MFDKKPYRSQFGRKGPWLILATILLTMAAQFWTLSNFWAVVLVSMHVLVALALLHHLCTLPFRLIGEEQDLTEVNPMMSSLSFLTGALGFLCLFANLMYIFSHIWMAMPSATGSLVVQALAALQEILTSPLHSVAFWAMWVGLAFAFVSAVARYQNDLRVEAACKIVANKLTEAEELTAEQLQRLPGVSLSGHDDGVEVRQTQGKKEAYELARPQGTDDWGFEQYLGMETSNALKRREGEGEEEEDTVHTSFGMLRRGSSDSE